MRWTVFLVLSAICCTAFGQHTERVVYYESGEVKTIYISDQNEVSFISFYEDGSLMKTGFLNNGKKNRIWVEYAENGQIRAMANYRNDAKTGLWKVWNELGELAYEIHYKDDRIINAAQYGESGEVIAYINK